MRDLSFDWKNACVARPLVREWEMTFLNGVTKNAGWLITCNVMGKSVGRVLLVLFFKYKMIFFAVKTLSYNFSIYADTVFIYESASDLQKSFDVFATGYIET